MDRRTQIRQLSFHFETEKRHSNSTFSDNISLPIHRWFRYSAGFSALWAEDVIDREKAQGRRTVLDPFAGSATVLLEAELCNIHSVGIEAHPFVARLAKAKLLWREDPKAYREYALSILNEARNSQGDITGYPRLIEKCFPPEVLCHLDCLRRAWTKLADGSALSELAWLTLASILRECSPVGTAQWQYVLPRKTKAKPLAPYEAFEAKIYLVSDDMTKRQRRHHGPKAVLKSEDARNCFSVDDGWADLIITSPPYANNYDYADATRLEMSFFGEVKRWSDLQDAVRKHLIRSCTQHVAVLEDKTYTIIEDSLLDPIRKEIIQTCRKLETERKEHAGKKPYHTMIAAYFKDMAKIWVTLRRVARKGCLVCFVIGDSAPYGIHVPVDTWLGELALAAGFESFRFEKTRDRNVKWKNRKHRVPLHEGNLWIQG